MMKKLLLFLVVICSSVQAKMVRESGGMLGALPKAESQIQCQVKVEKFDGMRMHDYESSLNARQDMSGDYWDIMTEFDFKEEKVPWAKLKTYYKTTEHWTKGTQAEGADLVVSFNVTDHTKYVNPFFPDQKPEHKYEVSAVLKTPIAYAAGDEQSLFYAEAYYDKKFSTSEESFQIETSLSRDILGHRSFDIYVKLDCKVTIDLENTK